MIISVYGMVFNYVFQFVFNNCGGIFFMWIGFVRTRINGKNFFCGMGKWAVTNIMQES